METQQGTNSAALEAQNREAAALSAPPKSATATSTIFERLKVLEARNEIPLGSAERIYQQAQLGLEEQERASDINAREAERKHLLSVTTGRRAMGYALMGFSGLAILAVFFFSAAYLHELTELPKDFPQDRFWLLVGGRVIETIVTIYFLYQVLKASERMAMPYWWAERYPEVVRLMLGFEDMLTASSKSAEHVAKTIAPLAEPLAKLVDTATKLLDTLKDKAKPGEKF